jgi:hypothetical protein
LQFLVPEQEEALVNGLHSAVQSGDVAHILSVAEWARDWLRVVTTTTSNKSSALHLAASSGQADAIKALQELVPANVWQSLLELERTDYKRKALHLAAMCESGNGATVRAILGDRRQQLAGIVDEEQCTALHLAAFSGKEDVIDVLCELAEDWSQLMCARNYQGNTALVLATFRGHWGVIKKLHECSSEPLWRSLYNMDGLTEPSLLFFAVQYLQSDCTKAICQYAPDVEALKNMRNKKGLTALELAESEIIRLSKRSDRSSKDKAKIAQGIAEYLSKLRADAAKSGDGSVENVGIKTGGKFQCPECQQKFDTEKAKQLHWKFIHDPIRHQED